MKIRSYQASDLAPLLALFTASVHGLGRDHYDPAQLAAWAPPAPDPASWAARLAGVQTLVAEVNGELAGFVSWQADGHIDLLFVAPSHARHGVATRLYLEVEAALMAGGVRELTVEASLVARPFFEHHGFVVHEAQVTKRQGVALQRYAMRKRISSQGARSAVTGERARKA